MNSRLLQSNKLQKKKKKKKKKKKLVESANFQLEEKR